MNAPHAQPVGLNQGKAKEYAKYVQMVNPQKIRKYYLAIHRVLSVPQDGFKTMKSRPSVRYAKKASFRRQCLLVVRFAHADVSQAGRELVLSALCVVQGVTRMNRDRGSVNFVIQVDIQTVMRWEEPVIRVLLVRMV